MIGDANDPNDCHLYYVPCDSHGHPPVGKFPELRQAGLPVYKLSQSMWVCHVCRKFVAVSVDCPSCGMRRDQTAKTYQVELGFDRDVSHLQLSETITIPDNVYEELQ